MSKTVLYYNRGTRCINRLVVSMFSLRRFWEGDVTVINEGEIDPVLTNAAERLNVKIKQIPEQMVYPLVVKSRLWQHVDHDLTMFIDADTVVLGPVDEYFKYIEDYGFVTGNFSNWKTSGGNISRRINAWKKCLPTEAEAALNYGTAINTGIDGWKKGNPVLHDWQRVCDTGYANKCTTRIVDEIACQLVIPFHRHYLAGVEWGTSVKYGNVDSNTKIVHYHGSKHCGENYPACELWKQLYHTCVDLKLLPVGNAMGDGSLKAYLERQQIASGLNYGAMCTVCTAVNKKYLNKFKANIKNLMAINPLSKMKWMVFAHADCYEDLIQWAIMNDVKIEVNIWLGKTRCDSMREFMLSAFVFGTAEYVKTKYWIKIDCDASPKDSKVEIPIEAWSSVLTAHRWGYTKVKKDPGYKGKHWLNALDDWANKLKDFAGTSPLFPEEITKPKHIHPRVATFFAVEKTAWTKHLAKMCGKRLPVPSQDTVTWYAATRLGRKVIRANFKKWFSV